MPLSAQFGRAKYIERKNWLVCLFDFVQHGRLHLELGQFSFKPQQPTLSTDLGGIRNKMSRTSVIKDQHADCESTAPTHTKVAAERTGS